MNLRGFIWEGILGRIGGLIGGGLIYEVLFAIWAGARKLFAPDQTVWLPSTDTLFLVWVARVVNMVVTLSRAAARVDHTFLKRGVYYFNRRVPLDFSRHESRGASTSRCGPSHCAWHDNW